MQANTVRAVRGFFDMMKAIAIVKGLMSSDVDWMAKDSRAFVPMRASVLRQGSRVWFVPARPTIQPIA